MSGLFSLHDPTPPDVAVAIAADHVSAAALDYRGGRASVSLYGIERLPEGALVPSLTAVNTIDRTAVMTALNRALEKVGRPRRIGLVLPDVVGKVSLVRFENVPSRTADLDQLLRWQVRKAAPFPIEEGQVSYIRGVRADDGQEFVVTLARRSVVEEYERLCAEAGAHAGLVDIATFNVINAVIASGAAPDADWLLVNVAADSASIAIVRGGHLIFFRNRAADSEGTIGDVVHQSAMYYEDRLSGGGFARVFVAGASPYGGDLEQVRRSVQERVATAVEPVDTRAAAALTDRITASPALLDTLAPLVGLLLRDRQTEPARA